MNKYRGKRVVILPAIFDHIDLIKEAKRRGCYIYTIDNNINNPGHTYADKSFNISILDVRSLFNCVNEIKADFIMNFSTDLGAITIKSINEKLGNVDTEKNAVEIMTNKHLFRDTLASLGFNIPTFQVASKYSQLDVNLLNFPSIIKPTDSAGSKGVSEVNRLSCLYKKFNEAIECSLSKKIIIENYIESFYPKVHGDAIVKNGRIIFICLGDQYFGKSKQRFSPIGTVFPSSLKSDLLYKLENQLTEFIQSVGFMNGGVNIEAIIDNNENIFFIEIAPRFGGNFIPKTIGYVCNLNLYKIAFDLFAGEEIEIGSYTVKNNIFQYILRSDKCGVLRMYSFEGKSDLDILDYYQIKYEGDVVSDKGGPESIIAIFIFKATCYKVIKDLMSNMNNYFSISIEA